MSKFTQRNASLFVQFEDGGIAYYLGDCADLDSIPSPQGGREYAYCWNRDRNGHVAVARKISTPDMITFSITELVDAAASWLEQRVNLRLVEQHLLIVLFILMAVMLMNCLILT